MTINAEKTKVMTSAEDIIEISIGKKKLEQVDFFLYLGSKVTNDADCTEEVKLRLVMGMAVMTKLTKMWKKKIGQ